MLLLNWFLFLGTNSITILSFLVPLLDTTPLYYVFSFTAFGIIFLSESFQYLLLQLKQNSFKYFVIVIFLQMMAILLSAATLSVLFYIAKLNTIYIAFMAFAFQFSTCLKLLNVYCYVFFYKIQEFLQKIQFYILLILAAEGFAIFISSTIAIIMTEKEMNLPVFIFLAFFFISHFFLIATKIWVCKTILNKTVTQEKPRTLSFANDYSGTETNLIIDKSHLPTRKIIRDEENKIDIELNYDKTQEQEYSLKNTKSSINTISQASTGSLKSSSLETNLLHNELKHQQMVFLHNEKKKMSAGILLTSIQEEEEISKTSEKSQHKFRSLGHLDSRKLSFSVDNIINNSIKQENPDSFPKFTMCEASANELSGNRFKIKKKKNSEVAFWKLLTKVCPGGVAIFKKDEILATNEQLSGFLSQMIDIGSIQDNVEINQNQIQKNWQNLFSDVKITLNKNSGKNDNNGKEMKYNLQTETMNVIQCDVKQDEEATAEYIKQKDQSCYKIELRKLIILSVPYTVLIIQDNSNLYTKISTNVTSEIKNLVGLSLNHETKTALNYLFNKIEYLKSDLKKESYKQIKYAYKLFSIIYDGLWKVALAGEDQQIEYQPENFNLSKKIQDLIKMVEPLFKNRGILLNFVDSEHCETDMYHDSKMIQCVFYQLLSNCIKFTKEGSVTVKIHNEANPTDIKVSITDTGIGMNTEEQKKLKAFLNSNYLFKNKISTNSTGANIGLSIIKSLMKKIHDNDKCYNRIDFQSEVGKGTTFTLILSKKYDSSLHLENQNLMLKKKKTSNKHQINNLIKEEIMEEDEEGGSRSFDIPNDTNGSKRAYKILHKYNFESKFLDSKLSEQGVPCTCENKILVIDDEEFNIIAFQELCSKLMAKTSPNYTVIVGRDGKEGIERFYEHAIEKKCCSINCHPIKLAVVDYNIPRMNGVEVTEKMTKWMKKYDVIVPIYGWTAYTGSKYRDEFLNAGATGILQKPLRINELKNKLIEYGLLKE